MTVRELAEYLATLDPELEVTVSYDNGNGQDTIASARVDSYRGLDEPPFLVLSTERDAWSDLIEAKAPRWR